MVASKNKNPTLRMWGTTNQQIAKYLLTWKGREQWLNYQKKKVLMNYNNIKQRGNRVRHQWSYIMRSYDANDDSPGSTSSSSSLFFSSSQCVPHTSHLVAYSFPPVMSSLGDIDEYMRSSG